MDFLVEFVVFHTNISLLDRIALSLSSLFFIYVYSGSILFCILGFAVSLFFNAMCEQIKQFEHNNQQCIGGKNVDFFLDMTRRYYYVGCKAIRRLNEAFGEVLFFSIFNSFMGMIAISLNVTVLLKKDVYTERDYLLIGTQLIRIINKFGLVYFAVLITGKLKVEVIME